LVTFEQLKTVLYRFNLFLFLFVLILFCKHVETLVVTTRNQTLEMLSNPLPKS